MGTQNPYMVQGLKPVGTQTVDGSLIDEDTDRYMGQPDGPDEYIETLDRTVGTFIDPCEYMRLPKDSGMSWLMYHVPRDLRGFYFPDQMPDKWKEAHPDEYEALGNRVDKRGYTLCSATTRAGTSCQRRAVNLSGKCGAHGGKLHPLDKVIHEHRAHLAQEAGPEHGLTKAIEKRMTPREVTPEFESRMTKWQKLLSGMISVDDLDDEELARCQCRGKDGEFHGPPPRDIPRALKDRMVKKVFERVEDQMRTSLPEMIQVLIQIAVSDVYEAADRIKAATWISERMLGKVPDKVIVAQEKPWETVLGGLAGGSRAVSRAQRGVADEEEILEAELVSDGDYLVSSDGSTTAIPDVDVSVLDTTGDSDDDGEPDPLETPTQVGVDDTPPRDPYTRQQTIAEAEAKRLATRQLAKDLKQKRKDALRRRIVAREQGFTSTKPIPFKDTMRVRDGVVYHRFSLPRLNAKGTATV